MKCPHCGKEIQFAEVCPNCGNKISYGGNTVLYKATRTGKLTYSEIFSNVFKHHSTSDALRSLSAQPAEGLDMLKNWQKPWLFMRLLAYMAILLVVLSTQRIYIGDAQSFAFMLSLVTPLVISLLIWEMDIPRGITILGYLGLLFIGGELACILAGHLNSALNWSAPTAAITEEPIKLLICVVYISHVSKKRKLFCLDGLVIGAAVGAGFAFWENVSYAFSQSGEGIYYIALARAIHGLGGAHMLYTAPFVGALCFAMNGSRLKSEHIKHPLFLITLAIGMGSHAINNTDFEIFSITISDFMSVSLKDVALAAVGWGTLLFMLRKGINQTLENNEINQAVNQAHAHSRVQNAIFCKSGTHAGCAFAVVEKAMVIGRDDQACNLVLADGSISRKHGVLWLDNGRIMYRDLGSSNGSALNGAPLSPNVDTALKSGDTLTLGSGVERFEVR